MKRILHIERGRVFRKIVRDIFEKRGALYFGVDNLEEAFNVLKAEKIDLIISGLELKNRGVDEFLEKINKTEYSNIPLIVVTSSDTMEMKEKLF